MSNSTTCRAVDDFWESLEEEHQHKRQSGERFAEYQRQQFEQEQRDARWERVRELMGEL